MPELRVVALLKKMPEFTLAADFKIASGERAVLIGKSGSGKTTLLRILAGLETSEGSVFLGDEEISAFSPQKRGVGMIFQDHALFPALSVLENAVFGLKMRGMAHLPAREEGLKWLEKVGLKSRADSQVARLSGGEAQRVAFVRALIWKPRLLLLDEPFSALDADLRDALRSELLELHRLCPVPLLLVSHDAQDVAKIATCKLVLKQDSAGRVRTIERASS
jgi:ABC-type Fe3+/spermidine/putrescine transport system ATPase subunit